MKPVDQAFDPDLLATFSEQHLPVAEKGVICSRDLFYQLNQSVFDASILQQAYLYLQSALKRVNTDSSFLITEKYSQQQLFSLRSVNRQGVTKSQSKWEDIRDCVIECSPIVLLQPCWLSRITQVSSCQSEIAMRIMSIYLQSTNTDAGKNHLLASSHALLSAFSLSKPKFHHFVYCQNTAIRTEFFDFASIQLCLQHFPRLLLPEILGFTLACFQMPTIFEQCFPDHGLSVPYFKLRQALFLKQQTPLLNCIQAYLELFSQYKDNLWQRIQSGFLLYQQQIHLCRELWVKTLVDPHTVEQSIARLFQHKSIAAIGHHQNIHLQGKSLDTWFSELPESSAALLQALKQSHYINQDQPTESRLLKLFKINGPMFGIFDETEIDLILAWISQGKDEKQQLKIEKIKQIETVSGSSVRSKSANLKTGFNIRQYYHYLINADIYPHFLPTVVSKLNGIFRICGFFNPPPFKHYSHQKFDQYIEQIYQSEMLAYRPLTGKPKVSKEAYIWGIEQIAPMILIDGCWLQNCLSLQSVNPEVAEILFDIYCDEIGSGQLQHNHPNIFQQLLESLSIQLPAVHSKAFIEHREFLNSTFDLPVYMLALSHHPILFLPELLGLNMAIELSGLGKSYLDLVDEWRYWGIDPTIANLHISIDNYASGHTFLARKAIKQYMDDVKSATADLVVLNQHWRRIYCGYASLRFVGRRFKMTLPIAYLLQR